MRLLPLRIKSARQGKRKRDRWGICKGCGYPAGVRCRKCKGWCCKECLTLRAAPGQVGVYYATCSPRCRKRLSRGARINFARLTSAPRLDDFQA